MLGSSLRWASEFPPNVMQQASRDCGRVHACLFCLVCSLESVGRATLSTSPVAEHFNKLRPDRLFVRLRCEWAVGVSHRYVQLSLLHRLQGLPNPIRQVSICRTLRNSCL